MRLRPRLAFFGLILGALTAHADTLRTFTFSSGLNSSAGDSVSGTIILDTTTGTVSSSDINSSYGGKSYKVSTSVTEADQTRNGDFFVLSFGTIGSATDAFLSLVLPVSSLQNYTGTFLCVEGRPCSSGGSNYTSGYFAPSTQFGAQLTSGSLSLVVAPAPQAAIAPEPSSIALLGTGLIAGAGMLRRRMQPLRA